MLAPLALLILLSGALGLFASAPWDSDTRERELAWLEALAASDCTSRIEPPTERLRPVARIARESCGSPALRWEVRSALIESHEAAAATTSEPELARAAEPVAGRPVRVRCWRAEDWAQLAEDVNAVSPEEIWVAGFADPPRGRIHLAPEICQPLRRFVTTPYAPYLNDQSIELAQALTTLAHEAEHVRDPDATEAVVECRAIQRVRGLVREEGRSRSYAGELAGLSWEISYPRNLTEYRTLECRDGGPLDVNPESSVWP